MPPITLNLRDIPLYQVLELVTDLAGLRFRIMANSVEVLPLSESDAEARGNYRVQDSPVEKKLNSIVLPEIKFDQSDVASVLTFLSQESRRLDPERVGVNIILAATGGSRQRAGDVRRFYRFKNDKESKLGNEPLPDGAVKAFRFITQDKLYAFVGRTNVKYIPINEQVEMELGNDLEVMVKPTLMNWEKLDLRFDKDGNVSGWTTKETWQIEVQNSKDIDVMLDIRRNFQGDWDVKTDAKYEKVDATKIKFVLPLKSREKQTFTYEVTTRYGTNVTR